MAGLFSENFTSDTVFISAPDSTFECLIHPLLPLIPPHFPKSITQMEGLFGSLREPERHSEKATYPCSDL